MAISEPCEPIEEALILAGGRGERLRSLVSDRPKVLAPVNGRPFLSYLFDQLLSGSVRRVVLCTGYLAEMIEEVFGDHYAGLQLTYSVETTPLGTGGALRHALRQTRGRAFFVYNGDSYLDLDPAALRRFHKARNVPTSMAVTAVSETSRYGRVRLNSAARVTEFVEKGEAAGPGLINAGIYIMSRQGLASIPDGQAVSLEHDLLPQWIDEGIAGFRADGTFIDIGTPASYQQARTVLRSAKPPAAPK